MTEAHRPDKDSTKQLQNLKQIGNVLKSMCLCLIFFSNKWNRLERYNIIAVEHQANNK